MSKYTYKEGEVSLKVQFDSETYINATEAYKVWGKKQSTFDSFKTRSLLPYAAKLVSLGVVVAPQNEVLPQLIVVKGDKFAVSERGTWLHPKLAIMFARWLSMDFEIWCDQKIEELLAKGKVSASAEERVKWMDKLPHLYKSISANKYWGSKFKEVVTEIDEQAISVKAQQKFIAECSTKTVTQGRLGMYKRMIQYYNELMEAGAIERRTWEDMTFYLFTRIGEVQIRRTNKGLKEIVKLTEENQALKHKFALLTDAENHPPLQVKDLVLQTQGDIDAARKLLIAKPGVSILYAGFIVPHKNSGGTTAKGKTFPHYVSDLSTFNLFSLAVWHNSDLGSYAAIERLTAGVKFNLKNVNGLHFGVTSNNVGVRYFFIYNPHTLATISYKHVITN